MADDISDPVTPPEEPPTPEGPPSIPSIPLEPPIITIPATPLEPAFPNCDYCYPELMPDFKKPTKFKEMYDFFLAGITDDMFLELTKEDTEEMLEEILIAAFPHFEFPRWQEPFDLDFYHKCFTTKLTTEEKMIIRQYMISEWIGFQLANIDLIRQRMSGSDFKFTSQASHIKQLVALKKEYESKGFHLQRLYSRRRKNEKGFIESTFDSLAEERPAWRSKVVEKLW